MKDKISKSKKIIELIDVKKHYKIGDNIIRAVEALRYE